MNHPPIDLGHLHQIWETAAIIIRAPRAVAVVLRLSQAGQWKGGHPGSSRRSSFGRLGARSRVMADYMVDTMKMAVLPRLGVTGATMLRCRR